MTQEDKQLLIKDLSARLSYGVVYHRNDGANIKLNEIDVDHCRLNYTDDIEERECKPYLRPMTSMSEDEKEKYYELCDSYDGIYFDSIGSIDWLNANHFDYHITYDESKEKWVSMIKKGLAIEVTKENNPYK